MARALTADMLTAIATGVVKPIFLYEGEFSGGTVHLFTGYGTLSWDGQTWTGDNGLMRINSVAETSDLSAVNFTVTLNGQVTALLSAALGQVRRGRPGSVWLGLVDAAGALISDPFKCFKGRADKPSIVPDPVDCVVGVAYESRLIDAARRRERRYTPDDQAIDYPADRGFDGVAGLQDTILTWGRR
jgi:hypothetical protein